MNKNTKRNKNQQRKQIIENGGFVFSGFKARKKPYPRITVRIDLAGTHGFDKIGNCNF